MARYAISALMLLLAGCTSGNPTRPVRLVETVEVKVPVPVRREPPAELVMPYMPDEAPEFVAPSDGAATSALTAEGEKRLKLLFHDLLNRLDAWKEWATAE